MALKRNLYRVLILLICAAFLFSACSPAPSAGKVQAYFQPTAALSLPESVVLVGIGEATHGNAEFARLRQEVLEQLVTRYGFRAFGIEGDFGGGQVVNEYVLNGVGTAEEAVRAIGFAIYRTQEMVDLVEWIRQYNLTAATEQRIHFYGYDMQRYDNNIKGLLSFFEQVKPALVEPHRAALADLNDASVFNQKREKVLAGLEAIQKIRADMLREKERYITASSPEAFDLADQYALTIEENATLRSGSDKIYSLLRDQYLAKKVSWILDYEKNQGRGKVLIAGHNGHIEKSAAAMQYRSMGSWLSEKYAAQYFAIGAEFIESTFNCKDAGSGQRKQFSVKNKNALNRAFGAADMDVAYLDIRPALESTALKPLLTARQPMSNVGDSFTGWYGNLSMLYTIQMVPARAYDAILFVRKATPTTMLAE